MQSLLSIRRSPVLVRSAMGAILLVSVASGAARAQQPRWEFTQQGLLITTFEGKDARLGRDLAGELRERVQKLHDKRELVVISGGDVADALYRAGFDDKKAPEPHVVSTLSKKFRADEILRADAERTPQGGGIRVTSSLILTRDQRLVQPLPTVVAPTVDAAAAQLATAIRDARRQLAPQRRCENALRASNAQRAIAAAREGVALYPRSTLARTCLVVAYTQASAPVSEVLREANEVLAIAPGSYWALDAAARAYDTLKDRERAAAMWLRVAATDSANSELTARVVYALAEGGNSKAAEPLIVRASDEYPDDLVLLRLRWRVLMSNQRWAKAIEAGERLLATDSLARQDSTFYLRLAGAYRSNEQPYRAMEIAARAVDRFPKDDRLYVLYTQLVRGEAQIAVDRGLTAFPKSAELHVLRAQDLKTKGKTEEALESSRLALELDSTLTHGFLQLAQAQGELGQHEDAFSSLRRALASGEDSALVAQAALSRGNTLFRAASGTRSRDDYQLAMRFLALADSLRTSAQSSFLLGAAALAVTQSAATDAVKEKNCQLSQLASALIPLALEKLTSGAEMAPDAARQYLAYIDQLQPVVTQQVTALCTDQEVGTEGGRAAARTP